MSIALTKKQFIEKAKLVHNDKYDYSELIYIPGSHEKITFKCPKHGYITKRKDIHLSGSGCYKCINFKKELKFDLNYYLPRCKETHNNYYDYHKFEYKGNRKKSIIICPKHGDFECSMGHHIQGRGCSKCNYNQFALDRKLSKEEFINNAIETHGNKYDYSKVIYINGKLKVIIICKLHGEFEQSPVKHVFDRGCPKCKRSHAETKIANWLNKNNINLLNKNGLKIVEIYYLYHLTFIFLQIIYLLSIKDNNILENIAGLKDRV